MQPLVNSCIRAIEGMKSSPGPALQDIPAVLESIAANGITIKTCENADLRFHDEVQVKYCASLVTNLESRFTDLPIISCFALFDPSLFVSDTNYGYDQIEILCNHYKLDLMSCKQEWMRFKEVIRSASTQTCSNIMNELLLANYRISSNSFRGIYSFQVLPAAATKRGRLLNEGGFY